VRRDEWVMAPLLCVAHRMLCRVGHDGVCV
jgi:hypothetical protein